jgi:hypothetical protein
MDTIWTEYANAIEAHLSIQLDLYMAVRSEDGQREEALNGLLVQAEERRRAAREMIRVCEQNRD